MVTNNDNMKTKYEVIWIDDKWEEMEAFKEECEVIHQIHLHPFDTQKEGMMELDKNPKRWDAIILDAKLEKDGVGVTGLREAVKHINQLALIHKIPYFISTGQPDLMDNETFKQSFGKYYIKERDNEQLIEDIKELASKSTRFQTKALYAKAIEQTKVLNEWISEKLLDVLEAMHFPEKEIDPLLYYNPLRQLLEYVFQAANKIKLIPDELIKDNVNINQCVQYLSGRNADVLGVRYGGKRDSIVAPHIKDIMFLVLNLGNINSHSTVLSDEELLKLKTYIDNNVCNSQYLIFGLALQVCEIVLNICECIKKHHDADENNRMCKTIGVVEKVEGNDSICYIRSKRKGRESNICLSAQKYKKLIGKNIVVLEESVNTDNGTNKQYPYLATIIQSLEKNNGSK